MTDSQHQLTLLIATALLVLLPTAALPCQCGYIGSVTENYPQAAAVFEGRVESISRLEPWWRYKRRDTVVAICDRLKWQYPDWVSAEVQRSLEQGQYGLLVTFRVTASWKGVSGKTIEVLTGFEAGDCGYPFVAGREYRVWAYKVAPGQSFYKSSRLQTHRCTRTMDSFSARLEDLPPDKVQYRK